jgi:peptide-methionine (S)-S-oxide reductase
MDYAVLGGGCFWCLEAVYQQLQGVRHVESGYTGGHTLNPDYESICTGSTGHAEVVKVEFDTTMISYAQILEVFFAIHDPTTLNRQGNDVGTQYRSVIYYQGAEQERVARQTIEQLEERGIYSDPIVTELSPLGVYYPAEAYHQNYFVNHPFQGYCAFVVGPKVQKFRQQFSQYLKD